VRRASGYAQGVGLWTDRILPHCIDFALSRPPMLQARERITQGLHGEVLEVGFGSGLNLRYYPPEVTKILAVDPSIEGKKIARKRIERCAIPLQWSGLDGEHLELADASVDCVLSTFTFCTIPDLQAALHELRRVLKPAGALHFLEHGRSADPKVARWQDRLDPLQQRIGGGCHLNRPTPELIREAGFCVDALETYYLPGPKPIGHMFEGRARRC
jgi:SAM-dependent methyltransferase